MPTVPQSTIGIEVIGDELRPLCTPGSRVGVVTRVSGARPHVHSTDLQYPNAEPAALLSELCDDLSIWRNHRDNDSAVRPVDQVVIDAIWRTTAPPTRAIGRAAILKGLRQFADWIEAHPDMPLPEYTCTLIGALRSPDEVRRAAHALGTAATQYIDAEGAQHWLANAEFAGVKIHLSRFEQHPTAAATRALPRQVADGGTDAPVPASGPVERNPVRAPGPDAPTDGRRAWGDDGAANRSGPTPSTERATAPDSVTTPAVGAVVALIGVATDA